MARSESHFHPQTGPNRHHRTQKIYANNLLSTENLEEYKTYIWDDTHDAQPSLKDQMHNNSLMLFSSLTLTVLFLTQPCFRVDTLPSQSAHVDTTLSGRIINMLKQRTVQVTINNTTSAMRLLWNIVSDYLVRNLTIADTLPLTTLITIIINGTQKHAMPGLGTKPWK